MSQPQTQKAGAVIRPKAVLPDRDVTSATLEHAYMSFIFYCNPALPPDCDIESLRESFRNPPKSGGKSFDTFNIYELVTKFYQKEIKTWTELTIQLGVERPDPTKDESSQKITQYGVRLKKWLNSLHIKSFFEYLMDIPNDYWTKIPNNPDPTGELVRDGVALEDDMALRALLPHIRPKRGRKRPDESETPISAQRQRLSPSSALDDQRPSAVPPWSAVGDSHLSAHFDSPRSAHPGAGPGDAPPTPFSRYPSSAITPTTRGAFWEDPMEPQSAITPTQGKIGRQRRGAKNVSSAWNLGGAEGSAKTRGRPRINRTPIEGPSFAHQPWTVPQGQPLEPVSETSTTGAATMGTNTGQAPEIVESPVTYTSQQPPTAPPAPAERQRSASGSQRSSRPSISLQVPQRAGGTVRLATPPPPPSVTVNGQQEPPPPNQQTRQDSIHGWDKVAKEATGQYGADTDKSSNSRINAQDQPGPNGLPNCNSLPDYYFEKIEDRTNVDTLLSFFIRTTHDGQWFDANGNPAEPASMDEAAAIVNSTMQNMAKTATSPQAFLINLGALAGARTLMTSRPKYYRMQDGEACHNYSFEWEYQFGHLRGHFNMSQTVPWTMWKRPAAPGPDEDLDKTGTEGLSAEDWKKKYKSLLEEMRKREQELADLRGKVMTSLREDLK